VSSGRSDSPYVLHVCTSCRAPGSPREPFYQREGYKLFQALKDELRDSDLEAVVELKPAECLSVCPRPCGIALTSQGSWSYLFGDQQPIESVKDIIECLKTYIGNAKGVMSRSERPKGLRSAILGRIPPTGGVNASV
jgi:predicted metal-binding protein